MAAHAWRPFQAWGLYDRPGGCLFSPRCTYATEHCGNQRPQLRAWEDGRVRCHYPLGDPNRETAMLQGTQLARQEATA